MGISPHVLLLACETGFHINFPIRLPSLYVHFFEAAFNLIRDEVVFSFVLTCLASCVLSAHKGDRGTIRWRECGACCRK